jgi:GNAT superfamily N-acetyltransferase
MSTATSSAAPRLRPRAAFCAGTGMCWSEANYRQGENAAPYAEVMYSYDWRGDFDNAEVNALHAEGFGAGADSTDWSGRVHRHSLGWVCARGQGRLIGFVNVAWDGGVHAFILDTMVSEAVRRQGVGKALLAVATEQARAATCEWLHVDFEEHLRFFYLDAGGFTATGAGVIALRARTG